MNWLGSVLEFVPVAIAGGKAAREAWKSRKAAPAEVLASKPRPVDAALRAMLMKRAEQRGAE